MQDSSSDSVAVSSRAQLLALARDALDAAPDVRGEAVDAARARINDGADSFDGQSIAHAMIDSISQDAAG